MPSVEPQPTKSEAVEEVLRAARALFPTVVIDGKRYIQDAVCTWQTAALVAALRKYEEIR